MEAGNFDDSFYCSRRTMGRRTIDTSQWASPDEGALDGRRRALYLARKKAVLLFLSGATADTIKRVTSLGAKQAYRLIRERCLETHQDGRPYGWRGLVPWVRLKQYRRCRKIQIDQFGGGAVGVLQSVLDARPELRKAFEARILAGVSSTRLVETKQSKRRHCAWFLDQLRGLGYEQRAEWPFNTARLGYVSIARYVDSVLSANPRALAAASGGPDLIAKLKTGDGARRPVMKFMQRVEMDAHKLDGRFCVSLPLMGGGSREKIVHRLWVIVILEVASRAILGYYFSMRREVSKDDVLRALKRGLSRWSMRQASFCDKPYLSEAGLLSGLGDEFVGLCWDEISVDGALAETCQHVRDALQDVVGATVLEPKNSFSKRRSKDDRPFIESFFRNLAGQGFQRLTNTTGGKPQDRKGRHPEEVALASRFQYEYAEELLDMLIANYNATPHSGIGNRTPLAYAKFLYQHSQQILRRADPAVVDALLSVRKRCVVRGGARTGRAPFVEFYYGRYTNEVLHSRHDLVGSEIWVVCHKEDDCRVALASTVEGKSLGVLRAAPPWNISPHSLSVRAAVRQACSRGQFTIPTGADAIDVFMRYVESHAHHRLPVHPAYLEARRILSAAADPSIGAAMLDAATARVQQAASGGSGDDNTSGEATPNLLRHGAAAQPKRAGQEHTLPPRRMAQSR